MINYHPHPTQKDTPAYKLVLPERDYRTPDAAYGFKKVFAKYVGLESQPTYIRGEVPHGWMIKERNISPDAVVGSDGLVKNRRDSRLFVARSDQEAYLRAERFTDVHAIGHPIIYTSTQKNIRLSNSLLIMPMHSITNMKENWAEIDKRYAEFVASFLDFFDLVVVCLYSDDVSRGNWKTLRSMSANLLIGADPKDSNSYERMAVIFRTFEYVTTNDFGSHVAYASYFGAKVSVIGPSGKWERSANENLTFYKNSPELLDIFEGWHSQSMLKKWYPQFAVNKPEDATEQRDWAAWELGEQCKRTPKQLKALMGWNMAGYLRWFFGAFKRRLSYYRGVSSHAFNIIRFFGLKGLSVCIALRNARRIKNGVTKVAVDRLELNIRNSTTDVDVCIQHFARRELLDIQYPEKISAVLDLGSNIGVSVLVFRHLFPTAKIVAVEMNSENFLLLEKSTASDKLIFRVNGAVWSESGFIDEVNVGEGEWALRVGNHTGIKVGKVAAYTFDQLRELHNLETIDVLKMDIEGAEKEVLSASWESIFSHTRLVIVEVHDWISGVSDTVNDIMAMAQKRYNLSISRSGEFTLVRNLDL